MPDLLELRWMLSPFLACLVLSIFIRRATLLHHGNAHSRSKFAQS